MQIRTSHIFDQQYSLLSEHQKELVDSTLDLFEYDPRDPILRNHELRNHPGYRSISADHDLRIIFRQKDEYAEVLLLRVGSHSIYKA